MFLIYIVICDKNKIPTNTADPLIMTSLQSSPYLERLIRYLIPYFTGVTPDLQAARAEALETLVSYGGRTRAELMNAVQVIILGFSTLETLGEAKTTDMSPSMRLRFRGCANNLNRNGQKTEQTLLKRLACDVPSPTQVTAEPINDIAEPEAEAALQQTQAENRHHPQPPLRQPSRPNPAAAAPVTAAIPGRSQASNCGAA